MKLLSEYCGGIDRYCQRECTMYAINAVCESARQSRISLALR